jgi:DUF4097 and DUF4098 domain-containing protein YvlB
MAAPASVLPIRTRPARRGRVAWKIAGSVLSAVTILLGTAVLWSGASGLTASSETQHETYQHAVGRVELDLDHGEIVLTPGEDDRVVIERRLEWSDDKPTIREAWVGDTLKITVRCADSRLGTRSRCGVVYTMRVPADVAIDAQTRASRIDARDLSGSLRFTETSGDVRLTNTTGRVQVRTSSGRITMAGVRAAHLNVQTTSGDVDLRLAAAPDMLMVTTRTGNVDIAVPGDDTYNVTVQTSRGDKDVTVRQETAVEHTIAVTTSRGDVRIHPAP